MAAPNPNLTEIVLATVTHGGTDFGIVKGMALQKLVEDLEIQGQGDLGATANGTVGLRLNVTLTYLVGPAIAEGTTGDLVITFHTAGGADKAHTFKNMKARGYTMSHQEKGEAMYTQDFKNVNAFSSNQHTIA